MIGKILLKSCGEVTQTIITKVNEIIAHIAEIYKGIEAVNQRIMTIVQENSMHALSILEDRMNRLESKAAPDCSMCQQGKVMNSIEKRLKNWEALQVHERLAKIEDFISQKEKPSLYSEDYASKMQLNNLEKRHETATKCLDKALDRIVVLEKKLNRIDNIDAKVNTVDLCLHERINKMSDWNKELQNRLSSVEAQPVFPAEPNPVKLGMCDCQWDVLKHMRYHNPQCKVHGKEK